MIDTSNLIPAGSADQPVWISGGSYVIGQQTVSPASFKVYTRKTNGAGTTDPSLDTTNWFSQIRGNTNLVANPTLGDSSITGLAASSDGVTSTLSGSTTAGVLKTIFSYTGGSGIMSQLSARTVDATSRTLRVKVTVDGISVYDATSSTTNANRGFLLAGVISGTSTIIFPPILWEASMLVQIASSLTEVDKITTEYIYNGRA